MPDTETERRHLAEAERDIAEGERRITNQLCLIEQMRRDGHDVTEAEKLLDLLRKTLEAWYGHRDAILQNLERRP